MTHARLAAARILLALDRESTTLSHELNAARAGVARGDDRALLFELVAGTLRWRNEVDALIAATSRRPLADLDPGVRVSLRLGVYQLRHLDRVPAHAVLHESVALVRELGRPKAAGLVNAVLRAVTRLEVTAHLPPRPTDHHDRDGCLRYLSITLSHPAWLVARWLDRYGFEATEAWCRYNNTIPEPALRVRPDTADTLASAGVTPVPGRFVARCLRLPAGALSRISPDLREALFIQDEGSQLVAETVPIHPGNRVLDACAAPGGKTLILSERAGANGWVVATDLRAGRMALLARTLAAAGVRASLLRCDARRPWPFTAVFDAVLLDVPCTGLGTLRRDPDVKWTRSIGDVARFAEIQRSMLQAGASAVKPGGALVYATCSSEPEENIDVVDAFLERNPAFRLSPAAPGPAVRDSASLIDDRGCLLTDPVRHGLDGFFAAILVRRRGA